MLNYNGNPHWVMGDRNRQVQVIADLANKALSWFEANRILNSVLQNDTANNAVNVLNATNALPKGLCVNHYLTDTDAWFVRTNAPRGLISYEREAVDFSTDNDFDTSNAKAKAYERYSVMWTDWRGIYGSPGV